MQELRRPIFVILWLISTTAIRLPAQESMSVPGLFKQLQSEETTDQATAQFLKRGPSDTDAKNYLAKRLPAIISEEPKSHYVWLNSVRLAGAFRITEAIPPLTKWINAATEDTGGTPAENNRLDPFPCAKALVQIGDPAVPALTETLEKGDSHHRWFAYRALFLIGSARAISALRDHLSHESDRTFKLEIQKALEAK